MKKTIAVLLFYFALATPVLVSAQAYLVNIPGLTEGDPDFNTYINAVYALFISLAALLAVVKLIVAGVKYMFSDVVTQKSDAKKDIQGALLGLVVVLAAVLILSVINPNLTRFDLGIEAPTPEGRILNEGETQIARTACAGAENCELQSCTSTENCDTLAEECRVSGRISETVADDVLACIGTADEPVPTMGGDNFVADRLRCQSSENTFYLVPSGAGHQSICCSGNSCPSTGETTIDDTSFVSGQVYGELERDDILTQILENNPDALFTPITALSNDEVNNNLVSNNIEQCEINNFTTYRLYSQNGAGVNLDIICIPNGN